MHGSNSGKYHVNLKSHVSNDIYSQETKQLVFFMPRHKKWRGIMLYPPNFCPSVRPSAVDHSCPLHNFDTVGNNFTKLGTNIKHDQKMCRD